MITTIHRRYKLPIVFFIVLSLCSNLLMLAMPLSFMAIIDRVIISTGYATLNSLVAILTIITLFELILDVYSARLYNWLNACVSSELISWFLYKLFNFKNDSPHEFGTAATITRLNELDRIKMIRMNWITNLLLEGAFMVVYFTFMVIINPTMAMLTIASVPFQFLQYFYFRNSAKKYNHEAFENNVSYNTDVIESIDGLTIIKSYNGEQKHLGKINSSLTEMLYSGYELANINSLSSGISSAISKFSDLISLTFGAYLIMEQKLSLGELIAFNMMKDKVVSPLLRLSGIWEEIIQYKISKERIGEIYEAQNSDEMGQDLNGSDWHSVCFRNVSFSFLPGCNILNNVSLEINSPGLYCFIGKSGCGKTTLSRLLTRVYKPDNGDITIDSVLIDKINLKCLRSHITSVDQRNILFSGTIRENILMYSERKDDEWLQYCTNIAEASSFIENLPNGYNTLISSQLTTLSGGQQQRLCIARAIANNPGILIMDEATSALDEVTEEKIVNNIMQYGKNKIVIFITHRMAIAKKAERIFHLQYGEVFYSGTYDEMYSHENNKNCELVNEK